MVEVHYHLLFDTDDGPKNIEDSLKLAEASICEGVTHIACTPHANANYSFDLQRNKERVAVLQKLLGDRVVLGTGSDFHLSDENIEAFGRAPFKYTINGSRYLLVEFSDYGIPRSITTVFRGMRSSGVIPVITHPERNRLICDDLTCLQEWMKAGCLIQITAASLTGRFGKSAQELAEHLLKNNWVHLVASDAHSIENRPPALKGAFDYLRRRFGIETAERLCIRNPKAVFNGEPVSKGYEAVKASSTRRGYRRLNLNWIFN